MRHVKVYLLPKNSIEEISFIKSFIFSFLYVNISLSSNQANVNIEININRPPTQPMLLLIKTILVASSFVLCVGFNQHRTSIRSAEDFQHRNVFNFLPLCFCKKSVGIFSFFISHVRSTAADKDNSGGDVKNDTGDDSKKDDKSIVDELSKEYNIWVDLLEKLKRVFKWWFNVPKEGDDEGKENLFLEFMNQFRESSGKFFNFLLSNQYIVQHLEVDDIKELRNFYAYITSSKGDDKTKDTGDHTDKEVEKDVEELKYPKKYYLHNSGAGVGCFTNGRYTCDNTSHKGQIFNEIIKDDGAWVFRDLFDINDLALESIFTYESMLTIEENNKIIEFINSLRNKKPFNYEEAIENMNLDEYVSLRSGFKLTAPIGLHCLWALNKYKEKK